MSAKISKIIFGNMAGIRDFKKLEKLTQQYQKAKSKNNLKSTAKLKTEVEKLIPDTSEELSRLYSIYSDAAKELTQETFAYGIDDANSLIKEIERMKNQLEEYKKLIS
jgi:hypothetical protein